MEKDHHRYLPPAIAPSEIVAIKACDELVDVSYSHIRLECAHGVGHGLTMGYYYDIFTSVKKCDLFEDELAQRSCVEGAVMENYWGFDRGSAFYRC